MYLAEKGLTVTAVRVDLASKEQFSMAYRAVNSRSVVPTLVLDDGTAIGEVPAIWRYLEEAFSGEPLMGATPISKALITMWERRVELDGLMAATEAVRNAAPGLVGRAIPGPHAYAQLPALAERGRQRMRDFYADLDERLADNTFVAGAAFSVADITALVTVDFAARDLDEPPPAELNALSRWYEAVSSRPSAAA
jgi:glutathione S-transferase